MDSSFEKSIIKLDHKSYRLLPLLDEICEKSGLKYQLGEKQISFRKAQRKSPKKVTLSGHIKDKETGEDLIGATVIFKEIITGTTTNNYGFYSASIPTGQYTISFSFIGYQTYTQTIGLSKDKTIDIELSSESTQINEVTVTGNSANRNIEKAEMSVVKLPIQTIKTMPALMGEVDLIKAIQMLPGVKAASEGSSGFSVRGGNPDQNLILLDEAPVYNPAHLMGFFSVFNNDAISDLKLYKGDIPASLGGRLSSVLDIRMKNGNSHKLSGSGGLGTISSRLTLEGPLGSEKTSFIISGRRSYADLFLRLSSDENVKDNIIYFYDLNAKINHRFNDNNRLFISSYMGKDMFKNDDNEASFGNNTLTLRWNHLFSPKLFSNITLLWSKYNYRLANNDDADAFRWDSELEDFSGKLDFTYFPNTNNTIKFGLHNTLHTFAPGNARGLNDDSFISEYKIQENKAIEQAFYVSNEQKIGSRLSLKYGMRLSMFQNIGKATVYNFDENFNLMDSTLYKKDDIYQTYFNLEPRVGLKYTLNEVSSLKASYARTSQYMQLTQKSTGGMPLDVWFPASPNVKPQISDQFALGYFRNFSSNRIEMSIETYYKKMSNTIDFKDFAELLLNRELEGELRFGSSHAYGVELMTKLNLARWNGWFSYTYSHTERTIDGINNGESYLSPYDRPHDFKMALNFKATKRTTLSANFSYSTGAPVTFPTGRGEYQGTYIRIYSDRNSYRLPDYHRLDLAVTVKNRKKPNRKWEGEWNFALYNAYGQKNPWIVDFVQDEDHPNTLYAEKTYLFSFVPSITYNFKF
jgi:hypothetical protein